MWTAVGPELESPRLGNYLAVVGETIHGSAQNTSAGAGDGTHVVVHTGDTGTEIAYSGDNGVSWTKIEPGKLTQHTSGMVHANGCFFISSAGGNLRSCDGGLTWDDITEGVPTNVLGPKFPAPMLVADGGYVYGFFGPQVYRYPTE